MSSNTAALILMGGQNKRMKGQHKAFLPLQGQTFLEHIKNKLSGFSNIYLSVDDLKKFTQLTDPLIEDHYAAIGPMGGIYTALQTIPEDYLFVTACDMPYITYDFACFMRHHLSPEASCFVLKGDDHFFYPLGAIYTKAALPYMKKLIEAECYSLQQLIKQSPSQTMALSETPFSKEIFTNINTPEDYAACVQHFTLFKGMP